MPFRSSATHLQDILEGIDHIEAFLTGVSFEKYREDLKTKSAVERQLQIITEAAKRLGDSAQSLCPGPDWNGFCRMGDILRHGYHKVDDEIVWNTIKDETAAHAEGGRESAECLNFSAAVQAVLVSLPRALPKLGKNISD